MSAWRGEWAYPFRLVGTLMKPLVARLARVSRANDASVQADLERLPRLLDRVDAWVADGTIGGLNPNAADYQIGTTLRAMMAMEDLAPALEGRPAADLARRILPDYREGSPPWSRPSGDSTRLSDPVAATPAVLHREAAMRRASLLPLRKIDRPHVRAPGSVRPGSPHRRRVAGQRTRFRLQRHVAARHQHGHDDRRSDGFPDPEHPEP